MHTNKLAAQIQAVEAECVKFDTLDRRESHESLSPIRAKQTAIELITCPQCGNEIPYEWNARGMTRCVQCHLLFENPEVV